MLIDLRAIVNDKVDAMAEVDGARTWDGATSIMLAAF